LDSNTTSLVIRRLQSTVEAETCARLMAASEPWITLQRDYAASLKLIMDPTRESYVALIEDAFVGFVTLVMQGAFVGYIQSLAVMPDWRNKGIGSQLLAFAEERIFRESPNVFLCVSSFNPDARRLYRRLGYQMVGELPNYIVEGKSEILLRKTIGPRATFTGGAHATLHIEHVAVWTRGLERLRAFYETYFGARAGEKYVSVAQQFSSYFLTFPSGARLELMQVPDLEARAKGELHVGYSHLAFAVGSREAVDGLTARLAQDGYQVVSGPRETGDGYYESCVLDPDGNRVEVTV